MIQHRATASVITNPNGANLRSIDANSGQVYIAGMPIETVANNIINGYRPIIKYNLYRQPTVVYMPQPTRAKPRIIIALHFKMCSYLGDYGAGRTLKTFSLLPGEKTTISVKNYIHNEVVSKRAENILDSFSESSANEIQTMVESQSAFLSNTDATQTTEQTGTWEAGGGFGLDLGIFQIGGGGGGGGTSTTTQSLNTAIATQVGILVNSTSSHINQTDALRQIEINTETETTNISETETLTVRQLENINQSRVLNFAFRQLLQEYFSITYLDDVSIIYTNGYPESRKSCKLSALDDFLSVLFPNAATQQAVRNQILSYLCSITDYTGTRVSFIEKITEEIGNCIDPGQPVIQNSYIRKRKDLAQTYRDKTVPGIIMDVTHRITRTPTLVVDAFLGQGEALDCYNQKLQDAATVQANLENAKLEQAIGIINDIAGAEQKAMLYKKVFTDCCDVPQCNCNE